MGMKVKANTAGRVKARLVGILLAIGFIIFVCVMSFISSIESRRTISVVRLKEDVSANAMITEDMIEEYNMYYKEFEGYGTINVSDGSKRQAIVTWDNRTKVVGKRYAAYFLRGQTVLFWDSTTTSQVKKNSYLYSMSGELLNIDMDTKDFGTMVVPGDKLNIRVSYSKTDYDLPSDEEYMLSGGGTDGATYKVTEMLFNEVTVIDMLNSEGKSIFDIYYSYISKSKAEQAQLLENEDFLSSVEPATVLVEATAEEADRFMDMQSRSPKYLITLLPRTGSSSIIDSLSDIQDAISAKSKSN